ncbi:hypothetical protein JTB14_002358 [Gonioctena quinquepunctata]|nr:hypothetical protein JTB14_002358 [Gonioctena quinquepunctata]
MENWLGEHQLQLAAEKTEAVFLTGPLAKKSSLNIGGETKAARYLGVVVDAELWRTPKKTVAKADRCAAVLSRLNPYIGAPSSCKRTLLSSVVHSIISYAAPVWHRGWQVHTTRYLLRPSK